MIFRLSCSSNGSSLGQWALAEQAPKRITPERMQSAQVPANTVIRPVATGRMTPAWLSLSSLPSRTNRKIQVRGHVTAFDSERNMKMTGTFRGVTVVPKAASPPPQSKTYR
jgi:hypothetical protein